MAYRKETHPIRSDLPLLESNQSLWGKFVWWVIGRVDALMLPKKCPKAEAPHNLKRLTEWVDGFTISSREPGEGQQAYREKMQAQYDKRVPKGHPDVAMLERCWAMKFKGVE